MAAIEELGCKFIDPMVDWSFKRLFGSEVNKDILIGFLRVVFPENSIRDITYIPTEQLGMMSEDRKAIFDVLCRTDDGKEFIVEMQRGFQSHFYERALFYTSFPIMKQGRKHQAAERSGESDVWDYSLEGVFFLGVLNFTCNGDGRIVHRYRLKEDVSGELMTDKLEFVFVEVDKFMKSEDELETDLDKWLFLLKNLSKMMDRPAALRDRIFSRIFDVAEIAGMDDVEQKEYVKAMNSERDFILQMRYATEQSEKNGLQQGIQQGLQQGLQEGLTKGAAEAKREDASKMLELGMPVDVIMQVTGLSEDVISSLRTANQ